MAKNKKDALERADELSRMPMSQLPPLALAYLREHSRVYGGCGEEMITALAHYAKLAEGLSCSDPNYRPKKKDKEFFELVRRTYLL